MTPNCITDEQVRWDEILLSLRHFLSLNCFHRSQEETVGCILLKGSLQGKKKTYHSNRKSSREEGRNFIFWRRVLLREVLQAEKYLHGSVQPGPSHTRWVLQGCPDSYQPPMVACHWPNAGLKLQVLHVSICV